MVATVTALGSTSAAVDYYEKDGYYAKDDSEHRRASFWHGEAALAAGLRGYVYPKKFESVLSGHVPGTDVRLGRKRDGEHVHRPGWDITLSAPKSVSLEALVRGDWHVTAPMIWRCTRRSTGSRRNCLRPEAGTRRHRRGRGLRPTAWQSRDSGT